MVKPRKPRRSRATRARDLPNGAFRLPTGGYLDRPTGGVMANGRHVYVQGVRRMSQTSIPSLAPSCGSQKIWLSKNVGPTQTERRESQPRRGLTAMPALANSRLMVPSLTSKCAATSTSEIPVA